MTKIQVKGMSCSHCTNSVKEALEKAANVTSVSVDLDKGEVNYEGSMSKQEACEIIEAQGFEAE